MTVHKRVAQIDKWAGSVGSFSAYLCGQKRAEEGRERGGVKEGREEGSK